MRGNTYNPSVISKKVTTSKKIKIGKNKKSTVSAPLKEIENIEAINKEYVKIWLKGERPFSNPLKSAIDYIQRRCSEPEKWISIADKKVSEFVPQDDENKEDSGPIEVKVTQSTAVKKPAPKDTHGIITQEPEKVSAEELVHEVILVDDFSGFPAAHKHEVSRKKIQVNICPTASDRIADYHVFESFYCNTCGKYYIDELGFGCFQNKLKNQYYVKCRINKLHVVKPLNLPPANSDSVSIVHHKFPLVPPKEKILVVKKTTFNCALRKHPIKYLLCDIPVRYVTTGKTGFVTANIQYCESCRSFSIDYAEFENKILSLKTAIILKTFNYNGKNFGLYDSYNNGLESPLMQNGYTVSQQTDLSSQQRHRILAFIIESGILTLSMVKNYLTYFMNTLGQQPQNYLAYEKWHEDYNWINEKYKGIYIGKWDGKLGWRYC